MQKKRQGMPFGFLASEFEKGTGSMSGALTFDENRITL